MSYEYIQNRIRNNEIILLDGGTGTEIEKQGVTMNDLAWCGIAHMEQPDVVTRVHESYIRAGSNVIIANTFATAPHILEHMGLADQAEKINTDAVTLALKARENSGENVCVAASMSSAPAFDATKLPVEEKYREGYLREAKILAAAGAELIVTEMMMDIKNASMVMEAANTVGLPVWLGMSASVNKQGEVYNYVDSDIWERENISFHDMASTLLDIGCDAAGIMHSNVNAIVPGLGELKTLYDGPTFAYAESGHFVSPSWKFEEVISPEAYLDYARQWVDAGVNMIGGCCGIGPEHIAMLRDNL